MPPPPAEKGGRAHPPRFLPSSKAGAEVSGKFDDLVSLSEEAKSSSLHPRELSQFQRRTTDQFTVSSDGQSGLAQKVGSYLAVQGEAHTNLDHYNKDYYLQYNTHAVNSPALPKVEPEGVI